MNIFTQVSIFLLFPLTIFSSPYTVTNYLDDITRQHHQKDILNQQRAIATETYNQSMAVTDWKINTSLTNSRVEPTASSSFVANYIQSNTVQFGIDRSLLATGGRLGFNFSHQRVQQPEVSFNGIQFNQPLFHTASFGIQFTQPLLFGFGGEIPKQAIRIASANAHQANLQTKDQFESFIYQELVNFVDWTLANEVTELSFSRFQLAREAYKQTKDRVQVNLSEKIDLLRAEYALEKAQQFWQSQNARLKAIQSKNASRLNQPSIRQVTPQFNLYETAYLKRPDYIVVKNLRIISSTSKQKDVLKHQLNLNQSQRNGNLTFTGSYDFLNGSNQFIDSQKMNLKTMLHLPLIINDLCPT